MLLTCSGAAPTQQMNDHDRQQYNTDHDQHPKNPHPAPAHHRTISIPHARLLPGCCPSYATSPTPLFEHSKHESPREAQSTLTGNSGRCPVDMSLQHKHTSYSCTKATPRHKVDWRHSETSNC